MKQQFGFLTTMLNHYINKPNHKFTRVRDGTAITLYKKKTNFFLRNDFP